jgi:hypothetical protein
MTPWFLRSLCFENAGLVPCDVIVIIPNSGQKWRILGGCAGLLRS